MNKSDNTLIELIHQITWMTLCLKLECVVDWRRIDDK
jgi:hypothetical protein